MAKVLFRAEASPDIGLGHLQRSMNLAFALKMQGIESRFFSQKDCSSFQRATRNGFQIEPLPGVSSWSLEDAAASIKASQHSNCAAMLVDSHEAGADYLAYLSNAEPYIIFRDDLAPYPFPCQMVLNGNADAEKLPYSSSSGVTQFLLGPEYIVLGQEYWEPSPARIRASVQRVLVLLGGTDHHNLMPGILGLLGKCPGDFAVTAVIGPYFANRPDVESAADRSSRPVTLADSPGDVAGLMAEADVAVSAAGQSLYELLAMGCPAVAVQTAGNQAGQLQVLAEGSFVRSAGTADDENVIGNIVEALAPLLQNVSLRNKMAHAGQQLVDGKGALRVARRIVDEVPSFRSISEEIKDAKLLPGR